MNEMEKVYRMREAILKAYEQEEKLRQTRLIDQGKEEGLKEVGGEIHGVSLTRAVLRNKTSEWILINYLQSNFDAIFDMSIQQLINEGKLAKIEEAKVLKKLRKVNPK